MILIFYAFGRELSAFKKRLDGRAPLKGGLSGFVARVGGIELAAVATGMGAERARISAHRAFGQWPRPELVISTGVAGGLSEGLVAGDLVIADRLVSTAADRADRVVSIKAPHVERAERMLRGAGIKFATGAMLTAERVLASAAEKRRAKSETGAIAVDMESAVLAAEALERDLPFACVRAILDRVDDEVIGAGLADEQGRVSAMRAGATLMRNPGWILKLPQMMRNLGRASSSIADAIEALCRNAS